MLKFAPTAYAANRLKTESSKTVHASNTIRLNHPKTVYASNRLKTESSKSVDTSNIRLNFQSKQKIIHKTLLAISPGVPKTGQPTSTICANIYILMLQGCYLIQ
jgi:hypothetical protein